MNPDENAPSRKYLRAASMDPARERVRPVRTYRQIEKTSSPISTIIRWVVLTITSIPARPMSMRA